MITIADQSIVQGTTLNQSSCTQLFHLIANNNLRTGVCQFLFETKYETIDNDDMSCGFYIMKPANGTAYIDTSNQPISALNTLRFRLSRPGGALINELKDDFIVKGIDFDPMNDKLNIQVHRTFTQFDFTPGDTIRLTDVMIYKIHNMTLIDVLKGLIGPDPQRAEIETAN